jgi:hypothetical protein
MRVKSRGEIGCRVEILYGHPVRLQEQAQRVAHGVVVVHNEDQGSCRLRHSYTRELGRASRSPP